MSAIIENISLPNPLRSRFIPPTLLADNAEQRIRGTMSEPFGLITTKDHTTLPLSIHNYDQRSFWRASPLISSSLSLKVQQIIDSQTTLSDQNEESLAMTLASRSLVTKKSSGEVISRSFMKFFNLDQDMAYKPTGYEYAYEIQEKVDGSLISLFWYEEDPPNSQTGGQWVIASRTTFSSPQTESAWNILNTQFSSLVSDTKESSLDKTKTYIFELVDNRMPIKIIYEYNLDLVLLSIISKDGSETRLDNAGLPFRRPRIWKLEELIVGENGITVTPSNLRRLSKLHRANEEGFVVTFWRTKDDVYPQRVKVKLEDYLKLPKVGKKGGGTAIDLSSRVSRPKLSMKLLIDGPPSPNALVDIYTAYRLSISSFAEIDARMSSVKQQLLDSIRDLHVMDDYGGEAWLAEITKIWDRIHALFAIHEIVWKDTIKILKEEGHKPQRRDDNDTLLKQKFDRRISTMDKSLTPSLKAWFEGQKIQEMVKVVVESVEVPKDLKSTEVIVLHLE